MHSAMRNLNPQWDLNKCEGISSDKKYSATASCSYHLRGSGEIDPIRMKTMMKVYYDEYAMEMSRKWRTEGTPITGEERLMLYKITIYVIWLFSLNDHYVYKIFSAGKRSMSWSDQCYLWSYTA